MNWTEYITVNSSEKFLNLKEIKVTYNTLSNQNKKVKIINKRLLKEAELVCSLNSFIKDHQYYLKDCKKGFIQLQSLLNENNQIEIEIFS